MQILFVAGEAGGEVSVTYFFAIQLQLITAIQWLIYAPFAGGFEAGILKLGFVDAQGITPGADVIRFMNASFYLFDAVLAAVIVILLPFVEV